MRTIFFYIVIIAITGCSHLDNSNDLIIDNRLIGEWKSDKEKTVEWLKKHRKMSDDQLARVSALFGKLKITINETTYTSEYEGNIEEQPIDIIAVEGDTIAIIGEVPLSECSEIRIIRIEDENSYSIYQDMFDIKEFFKRIK
jgi:hypothetical protein